MIALFELIFFFFNLVYNNQYESRQWQKCQRKEREVVGGAVFLCIGLVNVTSLALSI